MTATAPAGTGLRQCRLYRFYVTEPVTGEIVLGYVGETGRQPFERLLEHLGDKPWFDTVVRWEVDPQVYWGKDAVLRAETAAIRAERPLYNVKGNERNRGRIIPRVAIRQRRARDAAGGAPRWVHPDDRASQPRAGRDSPVRQKPSGLKPSRLTRGQRFAVGWGVAWLGSTLAGWLLALHWHLAGRQAVITAVCLLPAVLVLLDVALRWTVSHRTRRRWWRRMIGRGR